MIRVCAITEDASYGVSFTDIDFQEKEIWYWVDIINPTEEDYDVLRQQFRFDEQSIAGCRIEGERSQVNFYQDYHFIVLNDIEEKGMIPKEINVFIRKNHLVTVHRDENRVIQKVWKELQQNDIDESEEVHKGSLYLLHYIMDKIVDRYFTPIYNIEDRLNEMDDHIHVGTTKHSLSSLFSIRSDLAKLRRSVVPMRDVMYRIIHSHRFERFEKENNDREKHFQDIYEHLHKIVDMLEANRDLVADIRDSYISVTSDFANDIMKKLTIISTIFMPLTFIAGVYGMNFAFMPELDWKPAYFVVLITMAIMAYWMYVWFKKKGWFDK